MVDSGNSYIWSMDIDGNDVDSGTLSLVNSLEVVSSRDRMSTIRFSIGSPLVPDNTKTRYIFSKGRTVRVFAGYNKQEFLGAGIIDRHELSCASEELTVYCLDKGGLMGIKEQDEVFNNTKDSDIVARIAKTYDLATDIEATVAQVSRTQQNRTDYAFLRTLAANNGYEFFVEYEKAKDRWLLHFHKPRANKQAKAYEFNYSANNSEDVLRDFSPQVYGKLKKDSKLLVHAWLSDSRQNVELTEKVLGEDNAVEEIFDKRFQNKQEAEQFIKGLAKTRDEAYMEASAVLLGMPELRVGDIHTFKGLTFLFFPSLDGDYRIKEVTHRLRAGDTFYTELALLRVSS